MARINIVAVVRGGVLQGVYADTKEINVSVLDYDNLEETDDLTELAMAESLEKETEKMTAVY